MLGGRGVWVCVCVCVTQMWDLKTDLSLFFYPDVLEQASASLNLSFYVFHIVILEPFQVTGWL